MTRILIIAYALAILGVACGNAPDPFDYGYGGGGVGVADAGADAGLDAEAGN